MGEGVGVGDGAGEGAGAAPPPPEATGGVASPRPQLASMADVASSMMVVNRMDVLWPIVLRKTEKSNDGVLLIVFYGLRDLALT